VSQEAVDRVGAGRALTANRESADAAVSDQAQDLENGRPAAHDLAPFSLPRSPYA
jgi:hypothetical protein